MISRSQIDKAGRFLAKPDNRDEYDLLAMEYLLDDYRRDHLGPLSETTSEIQGWLSGYRDHYYIAQRLKRKPQIIRKIRRLSVRLSQLQDIGGLRIIVEDNKTVDDLISFLREKLLGRSSFQLNDMTDYRPLGRDDTGYRAVHLLLSRTGYRLELQIRSKIQHYWAETIERTSVIYGQHLKEGEGDGRVLSYFKRLSDVLSEVETGHRRMSSLGLEAARLEAETIISSADTARVLSSHVSEEVIRSMAEKERKSGKGLNNWLLIFDWDSGNFIHWDVVAKSPIDAVKEYVKYERDYPVENGFEVVLVGSSDISTVRQTHSHYFGIDSNEPSLESLDQAIVGVSSKMDLDVSARQVLSTLVRRKYWGRAAVSKDTLRKHFTHGVAGFDQALEALAIRSFITVGQGGSPISLNISKNGEIQKYV